MSSVFKPRAARLEPAHPSVIKPEIHHETRVCLILLHSVWIESTVGGKTTLRSNESNQNVFYTFVLSITKMVETNKGCMVFIKSTTVRKQQHNLTLLLIEKFSFQMLY